MDAGTHVITGLVLSRFFEKPEAKIACVVGSIFTDIALAPIYIHVCKKMRTWKPWKYLGCEKHDPPPENLMKIYYTFHSLFFLAALFLIAWLSESLIMMAFSVGYLSHLIWDMPTHTKEWAIRPFYPFFSLKIEGVDNWWKNKYILGGMVLIWIGLGSIYFFVL